MRAWWSLEAAEFQALQLSVQVALYCSLISLPIALLLGYQLARRQFYGKTLVESLVNLPLVMPPVTTGYLLLLLFGSSSGLGQWMRANLGLQIAFSFYAAVLASVVVSLPLVVRSIRTSMEMIDTGLEEASRILGAGKLKTFWKITLPLALPGIVSGTVLGFARSLGEFGATITFAGNIAGETQTLPLAIYAYMQTPGKEVPTLRLVLCSVLLSFLAMGLSEWYLLKRKHD